MELPNCPATLRERVALRLACERDAALRAEALKRCARDVEWFVDFWCYTFDPRGSGVKDKPFLLYPFQRDLLKQLESHYTEQRDLLIEKSRDMGVTWIILCHIFHHWLFAEGYTCLLGSIDEYEVDDTTIDSLFGKLDYLLEWLPGWMKPQGFSARYHRKKLTLIHPEKSGNVILGETSTGEFSRSGRYSEVFMDEGSAWKPGTLRKAWTSASRATECRIICGTPRGKDDFYDLRFGGLVEVSTIHWTLHPERDTDWYERQKSRMTSEEIAQELDISYERSQSGVVYPTWQECPRGDYPYLPKAPLWITVDFGLRDDTALIVWQRDPNTTRFRTIDCYSNRDKHIDFYVPMLLGHIPSDSTHQYSREDIAWISRRAGWGQAVIFGDPAGKQRNQVTGTSVLDLLAEYGVYVTVNDGARDWETRKRLTELGLRELDINVPACSPLDMAMSNARYAPAPEGKLGSVKPIHDWTSHFRSCVEFFFVNNPPISVSERPSPRVKRPAWYYLHNRG